MAGIFGKILKISTIMLVVPVLLTGAQAPNPRNSSKSTARYHDTDTNAVVRRSATSVIARNVTQNNRQGRTVVTARPGSNQAVKARSGRPVVLNNISKSRSAVAKPATVRSGITPKKSSANVSRAGVARATAVFNDVSKIGGGYADCRDSYATCMDQFCANANDTYRRCYCSDRFTDFRDISDKLDQALKLLAEFQDNNLNAVDKTAAEVNAMYTATAGEAAIKKDTSASQKLLDSISEVLAGKSSSSTTKKQGLTSLGVLDFSGFNSGSDGDIFSSSSSFFGSGNSVDFASLEGKELHDAVMQQCAEITRASCGSDAMFNLAKSSYSILITQDCNAYEKNINAKKASVEETVRTAEKYLRSARLDEYRAHNSQDVNECLSKVETAMRQATACGPNYEKCMDYTGLYINAVTGEPIYSQALFGLNNLIILDGSADVLGANPNFNKVLDDKKTFAATALDTCRDLSDTVWYEFKRSALIQIAQAQDERIQKIKDSCVATIKECYDTQSGKLKEIDTTEAQATGAIAAVTARGMCYEKVQACAALYGDPDGCKYDDKTKQLVRNGEKKCGLQSLLTFVDTVDSVKVAEGCEAALRKYSHELCDPKVGDDENVVYPMGCTPDKISKAQLRAAMNSHMKTFCVSDLVNSDQSNTLQETDAFNTNVMNQIVKEIYDELGIAFTVGCEDDETVKGVWVSANEMSSPQPGMLAQEFYKKYYGTVITNASQISDLGLAETGWCISTVGKDRCEALGETYVDTYNETTGECVLKPQWYEDRCTQDLKGKWVNDVCEINYGESETASTGSSSGTSSTGGSSSGKFNTKYWEDVLKRNNPMRENQAEKMMSKTDDASATAAIMTLSGLDKGNDTTR